MTVTIRRYSTGDVPAMIRIWNEVISAGDAFPQIEGLCSLEAYDFFAAQNVCRVARTPQGEVAGFYIVHPNNVGRCSHIANASYAVSGEERLKGYGTALVADSLEQARAAGFRIMQFNAVVRTNTPALTVYSRLGFIPLGVIPGGFRLDSGEYEDIHLMYRDL